MKNKKRVNLKYNIFNIDRTVGGMLSGQVALKYGHEGLPKNTINIDFSGNAVILDLADEIPWRFSSIQV